ncbi:MAG: hypothetical protein WCI39_10740 [Gallionellaceae bacterium]
MQLANISSRTPHLVQALEALALQPSHELNAQSLLQELNGITVLVARKFTNEKTAEGMLDAYQLTIGCISLGISLAEIPDNNEAMLNFLLSHGAEYVFQMGFRRIKTLAELPPYTSICDLDLDPFEQQRNLKRIFVKFCRASPNDTWTGDSLYKQALTERQNNRDIIDCAKWIRQAHYAGAINEIDLDAHAVITIALIFGMAGKAPIVARFKQKDAENLIQGIREHQLDAEKGWLAWLTQIPTQHHPILLERMEQLRSTVLKKILAKSSVKQIVAEIQKHAGMEEDIDYP